MLFEKIMAGYSENYSKLTNTHCAQNAELYIVKAGGTQNYHYALKVIFSIHHITFIYLIQDV